METEKIRKLNEKIRKMEEALYRIFVKNGENEKALETNPEVKEIRGKIESLALEYIRLTEGGYRECYNG